MEDNYVEISAEEFNKDMEELYEELNKLRAENEALKAEIRIIDRLLSKYMHYEYEPNEGE